MPKAVGLRLILPQHHPEGLLKPGFMTPPQPLNTVGLKFCILTSCLVKLWITL